MVKLDKDIPVISEELMTLTESIFSHGDSRAKNHDLRFGQYLLNKIATKYKGSTRADYARILFNLENQEIYDMIKGYND